MTKEELIVAAGCLIINCLLLDLRQLLLRGKKPSGVFVTRLDDSRAGRGANADDKC